MLAYQCFLTLNKNKSCNTFKLFNCSGTFSFLKKQKKVLFKLDLLQCLLLSARLAPLGLHSQAFCECKLFAHASYAELGERMQAFCACKPYGERMLAIRRATAIYAELGERMQAELGERKQAFCDCKLRGARRAHASGARRTELGERTEAQLAKLA